MKCAVHAEVEATGYCRNCGKALCPACTREVKGALYCEECLAGLVASPAKTGVGNPGAALVLGFIPGLGAVYNGEYTKALVHLVIWGGLFALGMSNRVGDLDVLAWVAFGLFPLYMAIDSYRTAVARRQGETPPGFRMEGPGARPVGGIVLIGLGVLFLLGEFGWLDWEWVGRFWPLALIILGVWIIYKQRGGGE
ncbi:MAG TPA: B-box zinc finger protein [Bryobacteraceae bacterium]|jgi:hypothetical protein|nr:B-box zinc finger protein [Bryobacteraceae bacterium]